MSTTLGSRAPSSSQANLELNRSGQEAFWNRQASTYADADMTVDNEGELEIVRALTTELVSGDCAIEDVVTLGGANGCRDPKVVLDVLAQLGNLPREIIFNDLSPDMVVEAYRSRLCSHVDAGIAVKTFPGAIHEIFNKIEAKPRRVLLGVYSAHAFLHKNVDAHYPTPGLEEYARNSAVLGSRFSVSMQKLNNGHYAQYKKSIEVTATWILEHLQGLKDGLTRHVIKSEIGAFRIVGTHDNNPEFFISHWFSEQGITDLVRHSFDITRFKSVSITPCAKGYVVCIDPVEKPRGIVTMLNNVLGNVLPEDQVATLRAIDYVSR